MFFLILTCCFGENPHDVLSVLVCCWKGVCSRKCRVICACCFALMEESVFSLIARSYANKPRAALGEIFRQLQGISAEVLFSGKILMKREKL